MTEIFFLGDIIMIFWCLATCACLAILKDFQALEHLLAALNKLSDHAGTQSARSSDETQDGY